MWFKVDDKLHGHQKPRKAGLAAMGLWTLAGSYASAYLTEGFIPDWFVNGWPNGSRLAHNLVHAGLWEPGNSGGENGWFFHHWEEYQLTKEEVEAERAATRERQKRWRAKKTAGLTPDSDGVSNGVTNGVSNGVTNGSPSLPFPSSSTSTRASATKDTSLDHAKFDEFWSTYPKKVGKKVAEKAWVKAVKDVEPDVIIAAVAGYARFRQREGNPQFTKDPATWLNAGSWEDERPGQVVTPKPANGMAWWGS